MTTRVQYLFNEENESFWSFLLISVFSSMIHGWKNFFPPCLHTNSIVTRINNLKSFIDLYSRPCKLQYGLVFLWRNGIVTHHARRKAIATDGLLRDRSVNFKLADQLKPRKPKLWADGVSSKQPVPRPLLIVIVSFRTQAVVGASRANQSHGLQDSAHETGM